MELSSWYILAFTTTAYGWMLGRLQTEDTWKEVGVPTVNTLVDFGEAAKVNTTRRCALVFMADGHGYPND